MNIFISGGSKNFKSMYAQVVARALALGVDQQREKYPSLHGLIPKNKILQKRLYYIATMEAVDDEDLARIDRHVEERSGWGFETIVQPRNLGKLVEKGWLQNQNLDFGGVFLLDSLTAVVSNEMFGSKNNFAYNKDAGEKVAREVLLLGEGIKATGGSLVCVSDNLFCGGSDYDEYTIGYMQALAFVDRSVAREFDQVVEVSFGQKIFYKEDGKNWLQSLSIHGRELFD